MSSPVDIPQNLHIHIAPTQRIPEPKKPETSNNQSQDFQDFFQNSQERVQQKEKDKKENQDQPKKHSFPLGIMPEEIFDDYDENGEMSDEKKTEINDLGNHIDTTI